ncbi:MAG TPA: lamin tail domain-containing protein [Spirochaetia bacterium]|nr:lamin tail domain-containing protein [Spirochaetia bacterium]
MKYLSLLLTICLAFFLSPKNAYSSVFINEISPVSNPEWVELYNNSEENIDISGWKLIDAANSAKTISNTIINAHEFYIFENSSGWLNNSGQESLFLKNNVDDTIDSIVYGTGGVVGIPEVDKSMGRSPDASPNWVINMIWSKGTKNIITSTPDPTPSFAVTEALSTTPTASPTTAKSIYKLNKSKEEGGQLITGVKINIDNQYIHHEDDEIIYFCDGCFCDTAKSIPCGFGDHTIKLTKPGYADWSEQRNFTQGSSYEITPILIKLPSNIDSTSTPSPTSTPIPTKTPTPTKIPTLTLKDLLASSSSTLSAVLGESTDSADIVIASSASDVAIQSPSSENIRKSTTNYKITFFIGLFVAVSSSVLLYFRHRRD